MDKTTCLNCETQRFVSRLADSYEIHYTPRRFITLSGNEDDDGLHFIGKMVRDIDRHGTVP